MGGDNGVDEIMSAMSKFKEHKKKLDKLKADKDVIVTKLSDLDDDTKKLVHDLIIEEKILSRFTWEFRHEHDDEYMFKMEYNYHQFGNSNRFVLDRLIDEYYDYDISFGVQDPTDESSWEANLIGESADGDYTLYIKKDPRIFMKWVRKLGLKIKMDKFEEMAKQNEKDAKASTKIIELMSKNNCTIGD